MTNEEKAKEIAENSFNFYKSNIEGEISTDSYKECEQSALEMAEWKDQQFIKFLEDRMGDEISVKMIEEFKEMIK